LDGSAGTEPQRPWWALVATIVLAPVAVWLVLGMGPAASEHPDGNGMAQIAPGGVVDIATLSVDHQTIYEAAATDREAFTRVNCYCGCASFLDHEDLLACFVRPDGQWEAHATGCAVCIAQAEQVLDLRQAQTPIDEIVRQVDARYAAIDIT